MITAVASSTQIREEWLTNAIPALAEMVMAAGGDKMPEVLRVTVSWPVTGHKGKAIGECYAPHVSEDKGTQITISPKIDDAVDVLAILIHELIHASVGLECGHTGAFKRVAKKVGLEGKMKATVAGALLKSALMEIADGLGPYPHSRMLMTTRKKQTTRMLKVECPGCEYVCRTTQAWLEVGVPTCPCGEEMVSV